MEESIHSAKNWISARNLENIIYAFRLESMSHTLTFGEFAEPMPHDRSYIYGSALVAIGILTGALVAYGGWICAVVLVSIVLILRWPVQVTVGALALLVPFDDLTAVGAAANGPSLTRYVGAVVILVLLSLGLVSRRLSFPSRTAIWWSLFVFWSALSLAWALAPEGVWQRLPTALSLLLLYLVASSFRFTSKELSVVAFMTVLSGCAAALLASSDFFRGSYFTGTTRSSVMMGQRATDPNVFAACLLLPVSLSIGALVKAHRRSVQAGLLLAIVLLGLAQLLTMSRGGLLALLTIVSVYVYRLKANRRLLLAAGGVALLLLCMPHSFFERLSVADRGAGRLDIWIAGLQLVSKHGFVGAGLGNFATAYNSVAGSAPIFQGFNRVSHSIYLGTVVELGIVGLILLILALRAQLQDASRHSLVPYYAASWGMIVMGLTLDVVWEKNSWWCWILTSMAVRAQANNVPDMGILPSHFSVQRRSPLARTAQRHP